jgi:hypothetical protein
VINPIALFSNVISKLIAKYETIINTNETRALALGHAPSWLIPFLHSDSQSNKGTNSTCKAFDFLMGIRQSDYLPESRVAISGKDQ